MFQPGGEQAIKRKRIPLGAHPKRWLAWGLSFAAGLVDAVGWLLLYHVYTAHMSGNTVGWGLNMAAGDLQEAVRHAWPLVPFVLGLLFSAGTTAAARRHAWHASFSIALVTEFALLATLWWSLRVAPLAARPKDFYFLTALPAAAMGIQTVTVTRIAGLRVYTTYVTGTLSKWAEAVVAYVYWFHDRTRGRFRRRLGKVLRLTPRQVYAQHAIVTGGLWITYLGGALSGAMLAQRYGADALAAALVILGIAIAVDVAAPVAAADEPGSFDDM